MNDMEYKLVCENGETQAHDPPHVVPQQHLKSCNDHMKQSENQTQRRSLLVVPSISVEASNHPVSTCTPPAAKRKRSAQIHSLFEKERRDKIKKKMRTLQALIPNCDKVDNASILDEAIDYVKNLQMQLLIMSMGVMPQLPPFPPFNFMTMFPTGAAQPLMTSSSGTTNYNMMAMAMAMAMAAGGSSSSTTTGSSLSHINMLTGAGFPHPRLLINPLRMNMINFLNPQWPPTIHPHTHPQATKELFKDSA